MFGVLQGLANIFTSRAANKSLSNVLKNQTTYQANPLAAQYLAFSKNLYNGRMPGASEQERGIYTNNANFNAQVNRNASSGSQALALAAAGQGQADDSLEKLQLQEQQNKMGLLGNLNQAYQQQINEGDKVYQDQVRRFQDYAAIRGAQMKNRTNAVNGIFNGLESDANQAIGLFGGGFGNIFGKKQQMSPSDVSINPFANQAVNSMGY